MNTDKLYSYIKENLPNICQVCVRKSGREIYGAEWNGYKRTDCTHIMSATKSIVSLLVGIAVDRGLIRSIDEPVLSFFPDYAVRRGEKTIYDVTLRHLLTMRAPYKGKGDPWTAVCSSADWTKASLDHLGGRQGITGAFDYRTVCLHILSGILYRATGMKTADFANETLFLPLGIARHCNFHAKNAEEHKRFTLDKTPKQNVWFTDPDGLGTPGYGLCMSACDMASIGQLCLDGGIRDGRQIVSGEWIRRMTQPQPIESGGFRGMQYGFLWWIIRPETNVYAAIGNSGNVIYVDAERGVTAAVSSYFKPAVFDRVDFIENILLPCLI